jgi:hypothetical protein
VSSRPSPAAMSLNVTSDPSPAELATLQTDLRFVFASTLLCSSLYGVCDYTHMRSVSLTTRDGPGAYLVISIISTYFLVQRQRLQGGQKLMLAYTGLAFVLATISHVIQSWAASLLFTESFFQDVDLNYCGTSRALGRLAMTLNLLCADGLLVRHLLTPAPAWASDTNSRSAIPNVQDMGGTITRARVSRHLICCLRK